MRVEGGRLREEVHRFRGGNQPDVGITGRENGTRAGDHHVRPAGQRREGPA